MSKARCLGKCEAVGLLLADAAGPGLMVLPAECSSGQRVQADGRIQEYRRRDLPELLGPFLEQQRECGLRECHRLQPGVACGGLHSCQEPSGR